jgi:hypothetical protein
MQFTTTIIGPDMTLKTSVEIVLKYLRDNYQDCIDVDYRDELASLVSEAYLELFNDNSYFTLVRLAENNQDFKNIFYSLPTKKPQTYSIEEIITKSVPRISGFKDEFEFSEEYQLLAPCWSRLELSVRSDENDNTYMYIEDFFPGFVGTGQGGVGSIIYNMIEELSKNYNCNYISALPIITSTQFWNKKGFVPDLLKDNHLIKFV